LLKAVPIRKAMWFEKFYWFVTCDGWLILSGRDSHQNELLVKRYMRAGDLYMHSDYGGAASTIIKGPPKSGVAPLSTLEEAAVFTVCRSKAWDTKIISSAWWVYHDQVSKSAPTGEYLPTGSFMIRGKRNFLHPNRMEMGLTLLYRLDN
jgi:predicted ribosome quality control (RQC) complex YloA/Tae2 family protein